MLKLSVNNFRFSFFVIVCLMFNSPLLVFADNGESITVEDDSYKTYETENSTVYVESENYNDDFDNISSNLSIQKDLLLGISSNLVSQNEIVEKSYSDISNSLDTLNSTVSASNVLCNDSFVRVNDNLGTIIDLLDTDDLTNADVVSSLNGSLLILNKSIEQTNEQLDLINRYLALFMAFIVICIVYIVCKLFYSFVIKTFFEKMF